ncbi:lytic polysaccharide monooxygenase auxiliary activity family 9 protein [Nocardiopsis halophila]|uniref:lytic polysaccharide monooxygenase auxiliary activity family 9 protein n=1 Tax=Nocardiopsis halophila TaxID=141692 RepID=UPI00034B739C|nr:lytic polysaccharide monooxygenase auxiliary activity family 9 protein [Nocardiopsis halophila]
MNPGHPPTTSRPLLRTLTLLAAAPLALIPWTAPANAHGSIVDPASRNYGCWERWGDDHLNPDMEQEDPMCWQAWQDDPNAMWNWKGLYRDGVGGDYQEAVPDGHLCSGGETQNGRYSSMDAVGPWKTTDVGSDFTLHLYDQAQHGADHFLVYVTRAGFDPTAQPLTWDDLELVRQTGARPPAEDTLIDVSAPGRSGHHVVFTIWQASHMDQSYYLCSDVNFV